MLQTTSMDHQLPVTPLKNSELGKKEQVQGMFDRIAGKYDFLNHFLTLGIDRGWRRKTIRSLEDIAPKQILDVATGTGDLAIAALRLHPEQVTGVDISEGMLAIGKKKITAKGLGHKIRLQSGDSEALAFPDKGFDAVTCAYGVRNFGNLNKGLSEMSRVLRPGGKIAILEFSMPSKFPVKQLYLFYFNHILPFLGKMVSKDQTAYTYLPESVAAFPEGKAFCTLLAQNGFTAIKERRLAFGITSLYIAIKSS
ncbi:MAG TPA: bifunctional demethylmenaquinone methyltransferase/2-methoxy-6-polyprenyl-1,4-benzoquinol methylase UbiE [Edaphocola sp.]|nr:bifunctional demethylmenaquinone methyltransferase/2-methoxy-6-polyprenyl-1,4-benzoquinol methylase UbiE [Edaphocola sp.]